MKKIINKNIIFNLTLLAIFAFALFIFIPIKTNAQLAPLGGGSNANYYNNGTGTVIITTTTPPPTSCTSSNWTSSLSPSTCPSSQQQTKTWTKIGTCSGGVTPTSPEIVSCTYTAPPPPVNPNPIITPAPASNPSPLISSLSPNSATKCSGSTPITITGQGFVPGSIANWDGSHRVTTYGSSTSLTIRPTDADMCGLGNYIISVSNPSPGGGNSNDVAFTLNPQTVAGTTPPPTSGSTTPATTTKKTTAKKTTTSNTCNSDGNSLVAGGIFGSDSFMPQTLAQWLLLLILILLAIILWRKAYLTDKRKEKPLKHA